jgi:hypothetical protein
MNIDIKELFGLFGETPPTHTVVGDADVPEPYHGLLVHPHHMTVTVEKYFGGPVEVQVLMRKFRGDNYARMIMLVDASGQVVQFGIVRIRLDRVSKEVRDAIIAENAPLGRILIENDVLRVIEPTAYLKIDLSGAMSEWFGQTGTTYGRLGVIHLDGEPTVELVEILGPLAKAAK